MFDIFNEIVLCERGDAIHVRALDAICLVHAPQLLKGFTDGLVLGRQQILLPVDQILVFGGPRQRHSLYREFTFLSHFMLHWFYNNPSQVSDEVVDDLGAISL